MTRREPDAAREEEEPVGQMVDDEKRGSRVYNTETRTLLLGGVFPELVRLAVVLADLLAVVQAPEDEGGLQWNDRYITRHKGKMDKVAECKARMENWYRLASVKFKPPESRAAKRGVHITNQDEEFTHDSVVLYTDLMYLLY